MVDIHSHILPFVDDGSESLEDSLKMLKNSVELGVTDIILTPHYRYDYMPKKQDVLEKFTMLYNAVKELGINVNLYLGQEIYIGKDFKSVLSEKKALTINDGKYLLAEFNLDNKSDIPELIYELKLMGYKPIVAHVERYFYVTVDMVREIKNLGGLIQVNASSIVGKHKRHYGKFIKELFKNDLVDFVASDVHLERDNHFAKSYSFVLKKFGKEVADKVFIYNAKQILKG